MHTFSFCQSSVNTGRLTERREDERGRANSQAEGEGTKTEDLN